MNSILPEEARAATVSTVPAIVIGSGLGGLAAALRLTARGYDVTVLEKLDGPGGRAYVLRQDGFTFDCGPTIITAPQLLYELWELFGRDFNDDVDLREMDPFFRLYFNDGTTFDYTGDHEHMEAEVARISPNDVDGYRRYLKVANRAYEVGYIGLATQPFTTILDLLRAIPGLLKMQGPRRLTSVISQYVKDPRIQQMLSFHPLLIGGDPRQVIAAYAMISALEQRFGVHSAVGGTGAIVDAMVSLLQSQGGRLRLNSQVEEILVENRIATGVRLVSGEVLRAPVVVSNADAAWTYRHLLPSTARRHWTNRKVERSRFSSGLFVWYFGTNRQYPDVPHHSILLGPRYEGLLDDIFKHKRLADDFSLYLYRPTDLDPELAPPGCDTFYVLSPVPHLDSGIDWEARAEPYRQAIQQRLEETLLPGLGGHLVTSSMMTPLDFQSRLLAFKGAAFSFEPVLMQSAWFRAHNVSEDVRGLYLVGAGTHPGAGVPGVLSSAKILDKVVPPVSAYA